RETPNGSMSHTAGQNPICAAGRTASLNMAENAGTHIEFREPLRDALLDFCSPSEVVPFRHHQDMDGLLPPFIVIYATKDLFHMGDGFGDQNIFCSTGQTAMQGNISCISPHDFYNEQPVMRLRRISDLIHGFNDRIDGSVKANGRFRSFDVPINGSWQTDTGYP